MLWCTGPRPPPTDPGPTLARAEACGRQLLLYADQGPLAGSFVCFRCGASALQPVLLQHLGHCPYRVPGDAAGSGVGYCSP